MERQGAQVKKLEANHAHLVSRNNFRVLIFQVGQRSEVRTTPVSLLPERRSSPEEHFLLLCVVTLSSVTLQSVDLFGA